MTYKGYTARIEYSEEDACLVGRVAGLRDIITFHVPGGEATRHLFGVPELSLVKPNVFVINTSRGEVCDFQATAKAVTAKRISGFACDVFEDNASSNFLPFLVRTTTKFLLSVN